ncbi:MAG: hypothetical protein MJZ25_14065 [Fibrobacter sp.]|nr:hypothetical protein [Fibrobacter sp.]
MHVAEMYTLPVMKTTVLCDSTFFWNGGDFTPESLDLGWMNYSSKEGVDLGLERSLKVI